MAQEETMKYREDLSNNQSQHIGDGCTIHSHVWIGDAVRIGNGVKIQAFSFIPNGVTIHDRVFIGPHVCFTNDRHPPSDDWQKNMTIVEEGAAIGANATILPGVRIGAYSTVGAGAVVTKDVAPHTTVVGNPAKPLTK